jgi:hypothetical protein
MDFATHGKPRSITVEAVVTRADGTVEDLGVVAYYHRNPLRRLIARMRGVGKVRTS